MPNAPHLQHDTIPCIATLFNLAPPPEQTPPHYHMEQVSGCHHLWDGGSVNVAVHVQDLDRDNVIPDVGLLQYSSSPLNVS